MDKVHFYNAGLEWKEGRIGEFNIAGFPSLNVATPPEFPKGVPNVWSPEHLFVASASACLMTTFLAIAENSNLEFLSYSTEASGKLEKIEGNFMISEIELKPRIVIKNEKDRDKALRIIHKSEEKCLISNSMKTKIILSPEILTAEMYEMN